MPVSVDAGVAEKCLLGRRLGLVHCVDICSHLEGVV